MSCMKYIYFIFLLGKIMFNYLTWKLLFCWETFKILPSTIFSWSFAVPQLLPSIYYPYTWRPPISMPLPYLPPSPPLRWIWSEVLLPNYLFISSPPHPSEVHCLLWGGERQLGRVSANLSLTKYASTTGGRLDLAWANISDMGAIASSTSNLMVKGELFWPEV